MFLCGEQKDGRRNQFVKEVRPAKLYFLSFATILIVGIHIRESFLELKSNAFAHDSNAVHSVGQCLHVGLEDVTDENPYHVTSSED